MTVHHEPLWHLRLARDDAAAAVREAVDHCHDVEAGRVSEPDIVFRHQRRRKAHKQVAFMRWLDAGYAPLRVSR